MAIVLDPTKRQTTLVERGLDFSRCSAIFDGPHLTVEDGRADYGERRYLTIGKLDGRMIVFAWTPRNVDQRVISIGRRMTGNKPYTDQDSTFIDEDDAPDLSQSPWVEILAETPVQRGRPKSDNPKVSTTIRLDADVLERFRAQGPGWQSRINQALRDWLARQ